LTYVTGNFVIVALRPKPIVFDTAADGGFGGYPDKPVRPTVSNQTARDELSPSVHHVSALIEQVRSVVCGLDL